MPLTCYCGDGDYDWYYHSPNDYFEIKKIDRLYPPQKKKKCSSCGDIIEWDSTVARFYRYRFPTLWEADHIYNDDDEIYLADYYLCEKCADLYFSFQELGFECVSPSENMIQLAKEYGEINRAGGSFGDYY